MIKELTDLWINLVTQDHDAEKVFKLFCPDGILLGTVSKVIREKEDIKKYFDFFVNLENIQVLDKIYYISNVTEDVIINNSFITWKWENLKEHKTTRITFIFKKVKETWLIYQIHSSILPEFNANLYNISGKY